MIKCSNANCNFENPDGSKFCAACGAKLEIKQCCPSCGADLIACAKFCPICGTRICDDTQQSSHEIETVVNEEQIVTKAKVSEDLLNAIKTSELEKILCGEEKDELSIRDDADMSISIDDIERIKELISTGADANVADSHGQTLLHRKNDDIDMTNLLIEHGADVNARDDGGATPLFYVENADVAKLLINAGADVNAREKLGETPLFNADNADVVKVLINAGADVNAREKLCGTTPLFGFGAQNADLAKVLINAGADVNARNDYGETPLFKADNADVAKVLINAGADVNARNDSGETPLFHVCYAEDEAGVAKALIDAGADVNVRSEYSSGWNDATPLFIADDVETIKLLINAGADINVISNGKKAFHAIESPEQLRVYVENGVNVNERFEHRYGEGNQGLGKQFKKEISNGTLLHRMSLFGCSGDICEESAQNIRTRTHATVKELLKYGADVNAQDAEGNTPLHYVQDIEVARLLLNNGAGVSLNIKNNDGKTPLQTIEDAEILSLLRKYESENSKKNEVPQRANNNVKTGLFSSLFGKLK